ncbi:MAG: hypothetical protein EA403_17275 [Spirochaetaceae bacterium]|nr:MAG: hypothetical protein EA403_17275 [Spirochaetaceae bacterium]
MSRALLICGNTDNPLPPFAQLATRAGFIVVGPEAPPPALALPAWNRRSTLAARTVLTQAAHAVAERSAKGRSQGSGSAARDGGTAGRSAESARPTVTDIVYVHRCTVGSAALHELSAPDIDRAVDEQVKGRLFLIREAVAALRRDGGGTLSLIMIGEISAETPPLEADLAAGFLALGRSMFTWYRNEPITIRGYQTDESLLDDFSSRLVEELTADSPKTAGKWQRFTGRSSLFSFGR